MTTNKNANKSTISECGGDSITVCRIIIPIHMVSSYKYYTYSYDFIV